MNRKIVFLKLIVCCILSACICAGCMPAGTEEPASSIPEIPAKLGRNSDDVPMLKIYNTASRETEETDIETYIMGVVAGEMKNTWPIEALKAQAILARTYTMNFVSNKESGYENADISTDIHEAQAYDAESINENVREAVNETRGLVMIADGEFPYAWFHAHAGGKTELPSKALEYKEDPDYLTIVESNDSEDAPADVKNWTARFSKDEIRKACKDAGLNIDDIDRFEIGEKGESGRAVSFLVNGQEISAPAFRLQIGSSKLKSTLIDAIRMDETGITFTGSGFGHGVGMSQWGAYQMAKDGLSAEDIVHHYFTGVEIAELW